MAWSSATDIYDPAVERSTTAVWKGSVQTGAKKNSQTPWEDMRTESIRYSRPNEAKRWYKDWLIWTKEIKCSYPRSNDLRSKSIQYQVYINTAIVEYRQSSQWENGRNRQTLEPDVQLCPRAKKNLCLSKIHRWRRATRNTVSSWTTGHPGPPRARISDLITILHRPWSQDRRARRAMIE